MSLPESMFGDSGELSSESEKCVAFLLCYNLLSAMTEKREDIKELL